MKEKESPVKDNQSLSDSNKVPSFNTFLDLSEFLRSSRDSRSLSIIDARIINNNIELVKDREQKEFISEYLKECLIFDGDNRIFRREINEILKIVNNKKEGDIERIRKIFETVKRIYPAYFDTKNSSEAADKLEKRFRFKALIAPGEDITKAMLYSFHDVYREDGHARISQELEHIRKGMLNQFKNLYGAYKDDIMNKIERDIAEMENAKNSGNDRVEIEEKRVEIKTLTCLLEPIKLEIKQSFRNEIALSLTARNITTSAHINPGSHLPFKNGLLNLTTGDLEKFNPDLFYTYQIDANYLRKHTTFYDCPMFRRYLNQVYYEPDIPMIISYFAYSFYPRFPVHKALFILGRERVGKGTGVRILAGLMPVGYGSVQLDKLLTAERFQLTGIIGKNVIVDAEMKRKYKRGTVKDWKFFNGIFGGDVQQNEKKNHEGVDYISHSKGIFIGNLPFFEVDNPAAVNRILLIETRNEQPKHKIPELDKKILEAERDQIATLLIQVLFKLKEREFLFPGELTPESTQDALDRLADPVENFIEEMTESAEGTTVNVEDAYHSFADWCSGKGIPTLTRQTFVKKFGYTYPKKKRGTHGDRFYIFTNCVLLDTDIEVQTQATLQVGHGASILETLNISVSGERYRRVQHVSLTFMHESKKKEKEDHDHVKDTAHMLDTWVSTSETRVNKASENAKGVSNLYQDSKTLFDSNIQYSQADPTNSAVQSEIDHKSIDSGLTLSSQKDKENDMNPKLIEDAWKIIDNCNLKVLEYSRSFTQKDSYKIRVEGEFSSFPKNVRKILTENFKITFEGSSAAKFTWLIFKLDETFNIESREYLEMEITEDIGPVASYSENYDLHKGNIVKIDWRTAAIIIKQGKGKLYNSVKTENLKAMPPEILADWGGTDTTRKEAKEDV